METNEIINKVGVWVASIGGGVVVVRYIVKIILAIINLASRKIPLKLTETDRKQIAAEAATETTKLLAMGIKVDVDGQIDKATNHQIELLKEQNREYIRQNNKLVALMRKMGLVVADLKSPSATFRDDLRHEIDTDFTSDSPIQSLVGDPVLATIEVSDSVTIPGKSNKKSKEKY